MKDAAWFVSRGNALSDSGDLESAREAYSKAADLDGEWSVPWYNLGLLHKRRREWRESLRANRRAVDLDPDDGDAWWNLGIAATALREWSQARRAWEACGIELSEGRGPVRVDLGLVPVRLNPEARGEVVWAERIDPARAIIANVPLPESGYVEGDVVLHDGAANGYRELDGRRVPVFDVIEVWERSPRQTFERTLMASTPEDVEELEELARARGIAVEDWTHSVLPLCRKCREGVPHEVHEGRPATSWSRERWMGFSCEDGSEVDRLLAAWKGGGTARQ